MNQEETFMMLDEFGVEREAHVLNVVEVNGREYIVYSIRKNEDEDSIFASRLIRSATGEEEIKEITDEEEKRIVFEEIRKMIDELD